MLTCAEIGYPKTKCQVIGIVRQKKRGAEAAISLQGKAGGIDFGEVANGLSS